MKTTNHTENMMFIGNYKINAYLEQFSIRKTSNLYNSSQTNSENQISIYSHPLKIDVYALDSSSADANFKSILFSDRSRITTLEAAIVELKGFSYGYHIYSLEQIEVKALEKFIIPPGCDLQLDKEWERLYFFSKYVDLAYQIRPLKEIYAYLPLDIVKILAGEAQYTSDFAEKLSIFSDDTLLDRLNKTKQQFSNQPGGDSLAQLIDSFVSQVIDKSQIRGRRNLRENPIILLLYGHSSRLFASFTLENISLLLQKNSSVHITQQDLAHCHLLYTFLVDSYLEVSKDLAEIKYFASKNYGDREEKAYAASDLGLLLASAYINPENINLTIEYLKESQNILKDLGPEHKPGLNTIQLTLRRLLAEKKPGTRENLELSLTPRNQEQLKLYNSYLSSGNYQKAVDTLVTISNNLDNFTQEQLNINSLLGLLYITTDEPSKAYKCYYRCKNIIKDIGLETKIGYFESLEVSLLHHNQSFSEAIESAKLALSRISHVCDLESLQGITNTLLACLAETDSFAEMLSVTKSYEAFFPEKGLNWLNLQSNKALALLGLDQYEEAIRISKEALSKASKNLYPFVYFDLLHRIAVANANLFKLGKVKLEEAQEAFLLAQENLPEDPTKINIYTMTLINFLDSAGVTRNDIQKVLENGFRGAEKHFTDMARLEDDINDRDRLLRGLITKRTIFLPYLRLFKLYVDSKSSEKLFSFIQRFKAKFVIEAMFSNSATMLAAKAGPYISKMLSDNNSEQARSMLLMSELIKAQPGLVKKLIADQFLKDEKDYGEPIFTFSVEHVPPEWVLYASENTLRSEEIEKIVNANFCYSHLDFNTAIVEFFFLDQKEDLSMTFGAIVIGKKLGINFIGTYTIPNELNKNLIFETRDINDIYNSVNALNIIFSDFSSKLTTLLPKEIDTLVICPTFSIHNLPLHVLKINKSEFLSDRYKFVYSPSTSVYLLSKARIREKSGNGFALIDPRSELLYSDEQCELLKKNCLIKFMFNRTCVNFDELCKLATGNYWLHFSAHGKKGTEAMMGFDSMLETGPRHVNVVEANLTALSSFFDCFPGLYTSVVVLSSCSTGIVTTLSDEPISVAVGLLIGGAKAVISPLWDIDEFATLLFMDFFYSELSSSKSLAQALQKSQQRIRSLSKLEICEQLNKIMKSKPEQKDTIQKYINYIETDFIDTLYPFADPFFWGAFTINGCDVEL